VSTGYSVARIVTAGKVFELGVAMAIVWTIMLGDNPREEFTRAIKLVVVLEVALVLAAIIGVFTFPSLFTSVEDRPGFIMRAVMVSPYAHSNSLSSDGALISAYALASFLASDKGRRRAGWLAFFALGTIGMLLASGRQGLIIWLVSVAVLLWVQRRQLFVTLIGPLTAIVLYLNWYELVSVFKRNQPAETLDTLSGRITYWDAAIRAWQQHPVTGWGFGVGGRFVALASIGDSDVSSLHSGYFEALTGLGLLGMVPLLAAVAMVAVWAVRQLAKRVDVPIAILIFPLVLHTSVALGFGGWLEADFYLLAFLAGLSDLGRLRQRASPQFESAPSSPPSPELNRYLPPGV
jgi:O-antigen ligase